MKVQFAQHGTFAQVESVFQVVGGPAHIQHLHTARAINPQGIVHRIGTGDGKTRSRIFLDDAGIPYIRAVVRTVAESINLVGRNLQHVGGVSSRTCQIEVDVVTGEIARAVLGIQKGETITHEIFTVRTVTALKGVDERPHLAVHLLRGGQDVLQLAALVIGTVAPVARLLHVQHVQDTAGGKYTAKSLRLCLQVSVQVGQNEVPKPAVTAFKGIFPGLGVISVAVGGVVIHQETVVTFSHLGITVVVGDVPYQAVPRAQHHVLRTLVNGKEIVRPEVIRQQESLVEIVTYLVPELLALKSGEVGARRTVRNTRAYPCVQPFHGRTLRLVKARPFHIIRNVGLGTGIKHLLQMSVTCGLEKAHGLGIVQHFQSEGTGRIVTLHATKAEQVAALAFLVVEVVLPHIVVLAVLRSRHKHVDRHTVDSGTHGDRVQIAAARLVLVTLRRGEKPHLLQHVVEQFGTACVQRHGRVGIITLQTDQVHGDATGTDGIFLFRLLLAANGEAKVRAALADIDTDVLARIFRGTGTLNTDITVTEHEVVFGSERGVIEDIRRKVRLLVVLGIHVIELVLAHDTQHPLAFGTQLVHIHSVGITQDIVLLVQRDHLLTVRTVHHPVLQFLVVTQPTGIDTHALYLHVRPGAVNGDIFRIVLAEAEGVVVDVGTGTVAVHIKLHQTALIAGTHHEGHLDPPVFHIIRAQLDLTLHQLVVLVGIGHFLTGLETRFRGGDIKPLATVETVHNCGIAVSGIAYPEGQFNGQPRTFHIGGKGPVADDGFRTVGQLQRLTRPAVAAPVKTLERGLHAVRLPCSGVTLPVAAARRVKLDRQAVGGLADIDTALTHVDAQSVPGRTGFQDKRLRAFLGKPVTVGHHAAGSAHGTALDAVFPELHFSGHTVGIIGHPVESELLVAAGFKDRLQMLVPSEDMPVGMNELQTDEGRAGSGLQQVDMDALAFQREVVSFHLGHQLGGMPPHGQAGHGNLETAVRRAAAGDRMRVLLYTVHVQADGFRAGTAHGVGYTRGIIGTVTAVLDGGRQVVTAGKGQGDALHAHVRLLLLRLARGGIGSLGNDVDVARAHQQVFGQVKGIGTLAHFLQRGGISGGRPALHLDGDGRFLSGTATLVITAGNLVVIGIGKFHRSAFLHGFLVGLGKQHDLGGGGLTAATAAGRDVNARDLRPALVGQRKADTALVVAHFRAHAEHGTGFHLLEFGGDGLVLDGIGTVSIQALVHFQLVDGQIHVALAVGNFLLAVHRQAFHRSGTAEVLPARLLLPARQTCPHELFGLPFALRDFIGDATTLVTVFLIHGTNRGGKDIITALQRDFRRHIIRVTATARTTGNINGGNLRPGLPQQGEFHRVVLLIRDGRHATDQTIVHTGGGILRLFRSRGCRCRSGICSFSSLIGGTGRIRRHTRSFIRQSRSIIRFRGRRIRRGSGIIGRFTQKGKRSTHQLTAAKGGETFDIVKGADLHKFINALALGLDSVQDLLFFRICHG